MIAAAFLLYGTLAFTAPPADPGEAYKQGHSHLGEAFDSGPRQKPWVLPGIGEAKFPITTKNKEVQQWFDQGNALLHSFWYYEAERAFRWAQKLEPENPMVYWGLARATSGARAQDFARDAVKRRAYASEREQLYIDAIAARLIPDPLAAKQAAAASRDNSGEKERKILETLCVRYPDDLEARSLLALSTMGQSRYGAELMIREILAKAPNHPGAHHYRIHNWDYHEPVTALQSSYRYGELVPGIGHALHMPGHIFSIVGMWNEAALAMDAATRAEKQYMKDSLTFPFNNWNYAHNRYYLSYIQEQLGMPTAAMFGARQLIDATEDATDKNGTPSRTRAFGINAMARVLLKFERWDELLQAKTIPWGDSFQEKAGKAYSEARAHLGRSDLTKAEKALAAHAELRKDLEKNKFFEEVYTTQESELKGRIALARGETIAGLGLLADAAEREYKLQRAYADPPQYPESLYVALGEQYLNAKSPGLAVLAFEKADDLTKNDLFALSGLVRAYAAVGDAKKAQVAMGRLLYVAADAEPGVKAIERAKATGIKADPLDNTPGKQRNYLRTSLEKFGPIKWEPYTAPALSVLDMTSKTVTLEEYRGKNVMLVFFLGEECPHCMRQLRDIGKKKEDWDRLDTALIAVSSAKPKQNAKDVKVQGQHPFRLLSDERHVNAQRFHSYDDFEDMELHSTILIDKKGRVYWARFGGEPFTDIPFLTKQIERMNELVHSEETGAAKPSASGVGQ